VRVPPHDGHHFFSKLVFVLLWHLITEQRPCRVRSRTRAP
jgi:hypothetical protein